MSHYDEQRESDEIKHISSTGLRELLTRHGIQPTGDSEKDIKLAKQFMPRGLYNEPVEWPSNERIDRIGQNGSCGSHYQKSEHLK